MNRAGNSQIVSQFRSENGVRSQQRSDLHLGNSVQFTDRFKDFEGTRAEPEYANPKNFLRFLNTCVRTPV